MVDPSPAAIRELPGSLLPFISLLTNAWRGRSFEAFMGVHNFAPLALCLGVEPDSEPAAADADPPEIAEVCPALHRETGTLRLWVVLRDSESFVCACLNG